MPSPSHTRTAPFHKWGATDRPPAPSIDLRLPPLPSLPKPPHPTLNYPSTVNVLTNSIYFTNFTIFLTDTLQNGRHRRHMPKKHCIMGSRVDTMRDIWRLFRAIFLYTTLKNFFFRILRLIFIFTLVETIKMHIQKFKFISGEVFLIFLLGRKFPSR